MSPIDTSMVPEKVLEEVLALLSPREAVLCLFNYIKEIIPLEHIICGKTERNTRMMKVLVDYTPQSLTQNMKPFKARNIIPWEVIDSVLTPWENKVFTFGELVFPDHGHYLHNYPYDVRSSLIAFMDINREDNTVLSLAALHSQDNAFGEEHREIFQCLRGALCRSVERLLAETEDRYLTMTEAGPLPASPEDMLENCPGLGTVMELVRIIAPISDTVLIAGNTGVGKELVAETLHALSPRRRGPLVKVNCGAIPDTLLDAELFGHEKGAFTGAEVGRPGYFEQANGGTIYLDEIGELPLQAQVRLLRVLDAREVRRVGGTRRIPLDIRVVAATHRDLWSMVKQGQFREDLWYRLNVFPIHVPDLAERKLDIPVLARHFYLGYVKDKGLIDPPRLTKEITDELSRRPWPGNVRELRYAVERAALLGTARRQKILLVPPAAGIAREKAPPYSGRPASVSREQIETALCSSGGKIQGKEGAAARLGLSPSTLRSRMKKLGIPFPSGNASGN